MSIRLVALDEGSDIALDRATVVVGRHPLCDVRLDSLRISRHHCCMTPESEELLVRDLGSTNGIRINGERVDRGRLKIGDELSIGHIRYRFEGDSGQEMTVAESSINRSSGARVPAASAPRPGAPPAEVGMLDRHLAQVVRNALGVGADQCHIQVIVQPRKAEDGSGSS
ncbi:FHA domain-containing protein [Tundrisphaera sp. TA3]|uniref:FHA domain-containing protein n=1 Tax=Tundrisphaera sp. TA3 TaxID=3435775 RepID=UPI003EB9FF16